VVLVLGLSLEAWYVANILIVWYCLKTSQYAHEGDIISSAGRAKQFSSRMGNMWRLLSDVTYPMVAYTTVRLSSYALGLTDRYNCRDTSSTDPYTRCGLSVRV
jgi:hypothetical protein